LGKSTLHIIHLNHNVRIWNWISIAQRTHDTLGIGKPAVFSEYGRDDEKLEWGSE
jgi:hypothetical protein